MREQRVCMHKEENRWIFSVIVKDERGRWGGGLARMSSSPPRHSRVRQRKERKQWSWTWREKKEVRREVCREGDISWRLHTTFLKGTRAATRHFKAGSQSLFLCIKKTACLVLCNHKPICGHLTNCAQATSSDDNCYSHPSSGHIDGHQHIHNNGREDI